MLPVPLTRAQVEEGFGVGTKVSQLKDVRGRVLRYETVPVPSDDDDPYLIAGKPYIINPTAKPMVQEGTSFEREPFTIKVSTTQQGVAGLYFKSSQYDRNYEIDHELAGPIYFIPDVTIKLTDVFSPASLTEETGAEQWTPTATFSEKVTIRGEGEREFTMKEFASYERPAEIPQYSYYYNKGQIRYATSKIENLTKGLLSYIQLTYTEDGEEKVYDLPFIDDVVFYEDHSETTGIDETFDLPDDPINLGIYDLQGRKVKTPRPGTIYIMNGKKVVF